MTDRILIVEDDSRIREELDTELTRAGYQVTATSTLSDGVAELSDGAALVLLDLGLPDGEGLTLCRGLRGRGDDTPVIVLTARDTPAQRVEGLDAGADDYVVKPFDTDEVLARVRSVLRRSHGEVASSTLRCGPLWIDTSSRSAGSGSRSFELTPKEFDLLLFFMRKPGRSFTRDQLLQNVWDLGGGTGDSRTIDIHIRRLRKKIEDDPGEPRFITTVWGVGYRMSDPEGWNE